MATIQHRLREHAEHVLGALVSSDLHIAADRIDKLEAEVEQLEKELFECQLARVFEAGSSSKVVCPVCCALLDESDSRWVWTDGHWEHCHE